MWMDGRSSSIMTGFSSWFRSGIGSFSRVGGVGSVGGVPVLENAPDFCMNSVSAFMPLAVHTVVGVLENSFQGEEELEGARLSWA